ncbi:MAG: MarR family transcriptional regulator [Desulfuromonadaceae bacterium]|nr:MarR family transcriptional regulator [Desulfuromonadaceae bacterium]
MAEFGAGNDVNHTNTAVQENPDDKLLGEAFEWLHNLSHVFDGKSREIEKITGLSRVHALTIKVIHLSPSITVSELARRMRISSVSMVRILDRLEKQKLIKRIRSDKDRRVVELMVTDKATDIDVILKNMTLDILRCCLVGKGKNDLSANIKLFYDLSLFLRTNSFDSYRA